MRTVSQCKQSAFEYYSNLTPADRLADAIWNDPYYNLKPGGKYGNLFMCSARIWIDRAGNIYQNKPSK